MDRQQLFNGLDLDDDSALHDQIDTIRAFEAHSLVRQCKRLLSFEVQASGL